MTVAAVAGAVAGAVAVEVVIEDSGRQISTSHDGQHKNPTSLLKLETLPASGDLRPLVLTRETFDDCTKSTGGHAEVHLGSCTYDP